MSEDSGKVSPSKVERGGSCTKVTDGGVEESVQAVDFTAGWNFGERQPGPVLIGIRADYRDNHMLFENVHEHLLH